MAGDEPRRSRDVAAALCAAAAIGAKQTFAPFVLAQCLWLLFERGSKASVRHAIHVALFGSALSALMILQFGLDSPWFSMVHLPRQLPWGTEIASRLANAAPALLVSFGLPTAILIARPCFWRRGHPLRLVAFSWFALLPLDVAGFFAVGGSLNSLHGLALVGPPFLLHAMAFPALRRRSVCVAIVVLATFCIAAQWGQKKHRPLKPLVGHLQQAANFADQHPNQVWFPWHPVLGYYADHTFHHVEDGWYTRALAGLPPSAAWLQAGLPSQLRYVALAQENWGLAESFVDPQVPAISWTGSPWRMFTIKSRRP